MEYIKTLFDHQIFENRIVPAGTVVPVDRNQAKRLIERGVAEAADKPAPDKPTPKSGNAKQQGSKSGD